MDGYCLGKLFGGRLLSLCSALFVGICLLDLPMAWCCDGMVVPLLVPVLIEQVPWSRFKSNVSRLLNYTPLATVIRLISLNCINLWLTMSIISFTGYDPELYLLAWIIIASVLSLLSLRLTDLDSLSCLYRSRFRDQQPRSRSQWQEASSSHPSVSPLSISTLTWDSYEIFVFTVVPVGILSFLTMVCSLSALYKMKHR